MSVLDWVAILVGLTTILGAVYSAHRFITKSLIRDYLSELKPNGGSSIKDKVDDIDTKVSKLENRIDSIYLLLIDRK